MGAPGRMTIRFRLGLALALALLPILALGAVQSVSTFRQDARQRRVILTEAAGHTAAAARARVQAAIALLETLTPESVGLQCTPRLAGLLEQLGGYENIVRLDRLGRVECAGATVPSQADRDRTPWFTRLRDG